MSNSTSLLEKSSIQHSSFYSREQSGSLSLFAQVSPYWIEGVLVDERSNRFTSFFSLPRTTGVLNEDLSEVWGDFEHIKLWWANENYALVPKDIFNESGMDQLAALVFPKNTEYSNVYDELPRDESFLIYQAPNPDTFPMRSFINDQIKLFSEISGNQNEKSVFLNVGHDRADLFIFDQGLVARAISTATGTTEDLLYFVLSTLDISGIDNSGTDVSLLGAGATDRVAKELKKYLRVAPLNAMTNTIFPAELTGLNTARYFFPFHLPLCE